MVSFRDILQLPCRRLYESRQPPTSLCKTSNFLAYNFQLPPGRPVILVATVIAVMVVMVVILVMVVVVYMMVMMVIVDKRGRDGTKLTFKLDFPCIM